MKLAVFALLFTMTPTLIVAETSTGALGCYDKQDLERLINTPGGLSDADLIVKLVADGSCRRFKTGEKVDVITREPLKRHPYIGAHVRPVAGGQSLWTNAGTIK